MPAARTPAAPLALFEVRFLCGGEPGSRQVWAPDRRAARRLLIDRASLFGLTHETVLVTLVIELDIQVWPAAA